MSVAQKDGIAQRSFADQISYEDLYRRWEEGNWKATEIDFSEDRKGWEALSEIQRKSALWTYSMFFYGEDSVTDNLSPYIDAAPKEEQKYFLATQQVDEARHSVFFHRFFKEVIGAGRDDRLDARLHRGPARLGLPQRLRPPRPDGRGAAPRPLAAQVRAGDRPLPPGRRGDPRPARPALHRGLLRQGGHDARLQRRHGERLPRRAAPHRLRRQGPLRAASRESEECKAAVVELLREVMPYSLAVFVPPGLGPRVHRCYGFSSRTSSPSGCARWRRSGRPPATRSRRCPRTSIPFDLSMPHEERAQRAIKLMRAGVAGEPVANPDSSPEMQALLVRRHRALRAEGGGQRHAADYQWRFRTPTPGTYGSTTATPRRRRAWPQSGPDARVIVAGLHRPVHSPGRPAPGDAAPKATAARLAANALEDAEDLPALIAPAVSPG